MEIRFNKKSRVLTQSQSAHRSQVSTWFTHWRSWRLLTSVGAWWSLGCPLRTLLDLLAESFLVDSLPCARWSERVKALEERLASILPPVVVVEKQRSRRRRRPGGPPTAETRRRFFFSAIAREGTALGYFSGKWEGTTRWVGWWWWAFLSGRSFGTTPVWHEAWMSSSFRLAQMIFLFGEGLTWLPSVRNLPNSLPPPKSFSWGFLRIMIDPTSTPSPNNSMSPSNP